MSEPDPRSIPTPIASATEKSPGKDKVSGESSHRAGECRSDSTLGSPTHGKAEDRRAPQANEAYQAALDYLYNRLNYEKIGDSVRYPFRLERMKVLMAQLGLEKYLYQVGERARVPLVHIAGTKGKGSTSTLVASILTTAGYRTGLYTSPHLNRLEERFRVDDVDCTATEFVGLVDRLKEAAGENEGTSDFSFFEMTTALALLHFDASQCDCIVLETGLGGRLDSTNVCHPSVTAITTIGLDHQQVLGNTLAAIAGEKAGIIKKHIPIISGVVEPEPRDVIAQTAARVDAPLFQRGRDFNVQSTAADPWGTEYRFQATRFPLRPAFQATLAMEGSHQAINASVATAIVDLLCDREGLSVDEQLERAALAKTQCVGRIERFVLQDDVFAVVDTAHNEDSIAALCQVLAKRRGSRKLTVVFGTSRDKDHRVMLNQISAHVDRLIVTRFHGNPRFQPTQELVRCVPTHLQADMLVIEDPVEATHRGIELSTPGGMLVVCGSFFLAAEVRPWLVHMAQAQTSSTHKKS